MGPGGRNLRGPTPRPSCPQDPSSSCHRRLAFLAQTLLMAVTGLLTVESVALPSLPFAESRLRQYFHVGNRPGHSTRNRQTGPAWHPSRWKPLNAVLANVVMFPWAQIWGHVHRHHCRAVEVNEICGGVRHDLPRPTPVHGGVL